MKARPDTKERKIVVSNKKAPFNYQIEETFEAGVVLTGAEIKSIREGGISISESYIIPEGDELILVNCHIKPYAFNADPRYEPARLLHSLATSGRAFFAAQGRGGMDSHDGR